MVILGIDFGNRRIGLAKSDSMGMLASGLDTLEWNNDLEKPVAYIADLTKRLKIERIVVGMPRNMDGSYGERARATDTFAGRLREAVDVDVVMWDERLTTSAALRTLRDQGKKTGRDKGAVDRVAACHILQSYLDSL
ncbi:MAG: Holliday junction resolvase RuvX [Clostridia bacterium]|nr:Holliday junction resolvase RuvX [Clostridia bacterium]